MPVADGPQVKPKLSIPQQISYMRDHMGITFKYISEEDAEHFLSEHNYLYKLKSYAQNYCKNTSGEDKGTYVDLDFSYLQELSTLDMYLRKIVLEMAIDIEHYLKVKLLRDISNNDAEDGYSIVQTFFHMNPYAEEEIRNKASSSACSELFASNNGHFSLWQVVELLSLGSFVELYIYYYKKYPDKTALINSITPVRFLRNAAAHNNGILRNLNKNVGNYKKNNEICTYTANKLKKRGFKISSKTFNNKMSNRMVHDFVCLVYVFNNIVTSEALRERTMKRLIALFDDRFAKHKEYFQSNALLCSTYEFVRKVLDIYE